MISVFSSNIRPQYSFLRSSAVLKTRLTLFSTSKEDDKKAMKRKLMLNSIYATMCMGSVGLAVLAYRPSSWFTAKIVGHIGRNYVGLSSEVADTVSQYAGMGVGGSVGACTLAFGVAMSAMFVEPYSNDYDTPSKLDSDPSSSSVESDSEQKKRP